MITANTSNLPAISVPAAVVVDINRLARWEVYRRLQELSIPCECSLNEPLKVRINDVAAALQLWCVIRRVTTSRQEQVAHLAQCWCLESRP